MLVIGVREEDSAPAEVVGVPASDVDDVILWLESIARSGVTPHLPGLAINQIDVEAGPLWPSPSPAAWTRHMRFQRRAPASLCATNGQCEVAANGYEDLVADLHALLLTLWATQEAWSSGFDAFEPLMRLASRTFESGGVLITSNPDGSERIDVPFTPQTLPRVEEAQA